MAQPNGRVKSAMADDANDLVKGGSTAMLICPELGHSKLEHLEIPGGSPWNPYWMVDARLDGNRHPTFSAGSFGGAVRHLMGSSLFVLACASRIGYRIVGLTCPMATTRAT